MSAAWDTAGRPRLGLSLGYWGAAPPPRVLELVGEAERLGFDSVFTSEAYGSDAFTPLAWWGSRTTSLRLGTAVAQIHARTPAATAMAAATLDHLSAGRLVLGLGVSGPQVVEGWYGAEFSPQLTSTREYLAIVRQILRRDQPLEFRGERYRLPLPNSRGKPLRLTVHPRRSDIPIWLGAEGPKNIALAAEIADGWLAGFHAPRRAGWQREALRAGFARREPALGGRAFEIAANLPLVVGDTVESAADLVRPVIALYAGGMGSRQHNFHFDLFCRMGFADEAERVRDLYLGGDHAGAARAVPLRMVEEFALVGPLAKIKEEAREWMGGLPTVLLVSGPVEVLRLAAELFL
ncbi:MAG: LLM class F420-dependent oxidoreductase [Candidatus Dormibacteraeota bacterium]|nr:LLM class F420-dependent oxidoreductase [Candidatus Dormibacteraeota bacterium]